MGLFLRLTLVLVLTGSMTFRSGHAASPVSAPDPCKTSRTQTPTSPVWRAHISHRAAIYMIQHAREFCSLLSRAALLDPTNGARAERLAALRDATSARILSPLYRKYPELQDADLPREHKHAGAVEVARALLATPRDITRRTATYFVDEVSKLEKELGALNLPAPDLDADAKTANETLQWFVDASAEIHFAEQIAFVAYPDLFAKTFRDAAKQPRTAERDAAMRKAAPARGSVRLSDAALRLIRSSMRQVRRVIPDFSQVATIGWHASMMKKGPNDRDWIDEGPGWTLGAYSRPEVPPDVIDHIRGLDIIISADDPSALAGKTFDVAGNKLVLRK
jgi:hypothetical protein